MRHILFTILSVVLVGCGNPKSDIALINTEELATSCLSLPIHTEVENSSQKYIIDNVLDFFK